MVANLSRDELRVLAREKAKAEGRSPSYIGQYATVAENKAYLSGAAYELAYLRDPKNLQREQNHDVVVEEMPPAAPVTTAPDSLPTVNVEAEPVKEHLPVSEKLSPPVNKPLPVMKSSGNKKGMLANGRSAKPVPSFENWFCRVFPKDITYPAWRSLSKTATDVANICRAKSERAAAMKQKTPNGVPMFDFTVSEAEKIFKLTRPTFTKAIGHLLEIGFIELLRPGGMTDGNGVKALYRLSEKWKSWEPPKRNNANIIKARLARKQNPCKGALNKLSKGALNSSSGNVAYLGKGALNENPYYPV